MWRQWAVILILGTALTMPGPVSAQVRVAILPVHVSGDLTPSTREPIAEALASGLRPVASRVVIPEMTNAFARADSDEDPERFIEIGRRVDVDALLIARATQFEQHYSVQVDLKLARDGTQLTTTSLECSPCTWSEFQDTVTRASRGVTSSLPGLLSLNISPAGAAVTVDGQQVDASSGHFPLSPGIHRIEARIEGFEPWSQRVTIVSGGMSEARVTLAPVESTTTMVSLPLVEDTSVSDNQRLRRYRLWAWITAGAALAATVPGVLWLALDGECHITWNDADGICPEVYDLWPQGLALTLVGAALVPVSVSFFIITRRGHRSRREVSLRLYPGRDRTAVVLVGRF